MAALSPRHLVLNRIKSIISKDAVSDSSSVDLKLPVQGFMQLYSFYEPSLPTGPYTITAKQQVTIPGEPSIPDLKCPDQKFEVLAPQFVIPPADIHSVYPPQGHADQPNVLPHIVFSDPHLPWERLALPSPQAEFHQPDNAINKIPWLALLVFDPNGPDAELRLDAGLLAKLPSTSSPVKQTTNFGVHMTIAQYLSLPPLVKTPTFTDVTEDPSTAVDVIFLKAYMFRSFFASKTNPSQIDVTRYKYLSHVRNVNTDGMSQAAALGEGTGLFSILHSHRTGPWNVKEGAAPRPQVVHLVTIEHVSEMVMPGDGDLVGLVSLYSWTYLCQPPLGVNFVDSMRAIGSQLKTQNPKASASDQLADFQYFKKWWLAKQRMLSRLKNGYSLIRYRPASGEETIAFNRGPLVPMLVPHFGDQWPLSSNNGQCYQIVDQDLGIVDISYSAAWQLGKTLAIGDCAFVAALMRVRGEVWTAGVNAVNESVSRRFGQKGKMDVLSGLHNTVIAIHITHTKDPPPPGQRHRDPCNVPERPMFTAVTQDMNLETKEAFHRGVKSQVVKTTSSSAGTIFNETDPPVSPDWALVHSWMMDKLYLGSIPNHYLITDPSHLPPESIRFFHIDPTWMDCFLDGALSVANHLSREDDVVRHNLKLRFNDYLSKNLHDRLLPHFPQVPTYGFFLRSKVVSVFPDLVVAVPYANKADQGERAEVVAQKHMGKDVMLVLLDRIPDGGEIKSIIISQPPHQQSFSAGDNLNESTIEFLFRKIYPSGFNPPPGLWGDLTDGNIVYNSDHTQDPPSQPKPIYNWNTRCLDMDVFASLLTTPGSTEGLLQKFMPAHAATDTDARMTSSMVGLELNDMIMFLEMDAPPVNPASAQHLSPIKGDARQIWTGPITFSQPAVSTSTSSRASKLAPQTTTAAAPSTAAIKVPPPVKVPGPISPSPSNFLSNATGLRPGELQSLSRTVSHAVVGAPGPQYDLAVYPSTTSAASFPPHKVSSSVFTDAPIYVDLIFSLTHVRNLSPVNLDLFSVEVRIPLGRASGRPLSDDIGGPGLMETYDGPGARMLSNQRWIVHIDLELPKMLVMRILPRSLSWTSKLYSNPNLSFRLNECLIMPIDSDGVKISTRVFETYRTRLNTNPVTWEEQGIGKNILVKIERKTGWTPPPPLPGPSGVSSR
ncbi:hypothetical protein F5884DRAFT_687599 [Xylogone sp. PMI_703]|nr:hypothetical protein F5884DRAFT_687599 [Xylogone sp. PMI_703]